MSFSEKVLQLKQDFDDVYEAGKRDGGGSGIEWDMLTDYGRKTSYQYGFYYCRLADANGNSLFNPKYDIKPATANSMFERSTGNIDLQAQFEKAGKTLDFSNCTNVSRCFYYSDVTRIGVVDVTKSQNLTGIFGYCSSLRKIDGIVFSKGVSYTLSNAFLSCGALSDVTASGELATSGLDLSACPLTRASKLSFLKVLVSTSDAKTIKFGAGEALTNEDVAIGTQKGWSVIV